MLPADKSIFIGLLLPRPIRSSSVCNKIMSNTKKSGSSDVPTLRSGKKKRGAVEFFFLFLTNFEVFGYLQLQNSRPLLNCILQAAFFKELGISIPRQISHSVI